MTRSGMQPGRGQSGREQILLLERPQNFLSPQPGHDARHQQGRGRAKFDIRPGPENLVQGALGKAAIRQGRVEQGPTREKRNDFPR